MHIEARLKEAFDDIDEDEDLKVADYIIDKVKDMIAESQIVIGKKKLDNMPKRMWSVYFVGKKGQKVYDAESLALTKRECEKRWFKYIRSFDISSQIELAEKVKCERVIITIQSL